MEEADQYALALRTQLAERRALWTILQELIGRYAESFDDPDAALRNLSERIIFRLERKDDDALAKGLELPLATVKVAVGRFFSELAGRLSAGEL